MTTNALAGTVLAIEPDALHRLLAGEAVSKPALTTLATRRGQIAVIPIRGGIDRWGGMIAELLGGTGIESIRRQLRAAMADPDVRSIVLDVDSPGGDVAGVTELAAEIRAARDLKPIIALGDTMACSAAFWLASQASALYAVPSATVGSVGVVAVHYDVSRMLDEQGIVPTIIRSDPRKAEAMELEPLSADAKGRLQARVNAGYRTFVADVAAGRRVSAGMVLADYGGGIAMLASEALAAGVIDGIASIDDVLALAAESMPRATAAKPAAAKPRRRGNMFEEAMADAAGERDRELLRTAVHESGHALVAARVGLPPTSILVLDGANGATVCNAASSSLRTLPAEDLAAAGRRAVLYARAGQAACEVAGLDDLADDGADRDRADALEQARAYGLADPEAESAAAYRRAVAILREDGAEPLARLTAALQANGGRLAGSEVLVALRYSSRPERIIDAERRAAQVDVVVARATFERSIAEAQAAGRRINENLRARMWAEAMEAARPAAK